MDFSPETLLIFLELFIIVTALGVVLTPEVLEAAFFTFRNFIRISRCIYIT